MEEKPVLIVDNTIPFCCRIMQFIFKSGGSDKFYFLSINSEESERLLSEYNLPEGTTNFMILLEKGKLYVNSGAFFQSTRKLNRYIPIFYCYTVLPEKSKNSVYNELTASFSEEE